MAYGSLFERLDGSAELRDGIPNNDAISASVAAHLSKMLSTRAGSVQALPDYGLPDLNDMRLSLHDSLQKARAAIERFIEVYEPRLSQVKVLTLPRDHDPLNLSFAIEGMLTLDGMRQAVSFAVRLDGRGQAMVQ